MTNEEWIEGIGDSVINTKRLNILAEARNAEAAITSEEGDGESFELTIQAEIHSETADVVGEPLPDFSYSPEPEIQSVGPVLQDDKEKSNVAVLTEIVDATEEEEKPNVQLLVKWARSKGKAKTHTMVVREDRKRESFKKAVDVNAKNIVIIERDTDGNTDNQSQKPSNNLQVH